MFKTIFLTCLLPCCFCLLDGGITETFTESLLYIAPDIAHKMTLSTRPSTVEELITVVKEKFRPRLDFDFSLQYEDPDFGGQLCFLTDNSEGRIETTPI